VKQPTKSDCYGYGTYADVALSIFGAQCPHGLAIGHKTREIVQGEHVMTTHAFRLYRSGYSGKELPWGYNQLWADQEDCILPLDQGSAQITLRPQYGSAAAWYVVSFYPLDSPEDGWVNYKARLEIDNCYMGTLPLAWYVGAPSDWPSGLARFPETHGVETAQVRYPDAIRGVWTLAARRDT
jgi:hypothetical protein